MASLTANRGKSVGALASRFRHPDASGVNEESAMSCPFDDDPDDKRRTWLSRCQLVAVFVFLTLFAGLVVWTTVAMPAPVTEFKFELIVPAVPSSDAPQDRSAARKEQS